MNHYLKIVATLAVALIVFGAGYQYAAALYQADMAEYKKEQAIVVREIQENHAKSLAKATDTILVAQDEYAAMRVERDRALERLRNNAGRRDQDSAEPALRARIAACEKLVSELAEAGSRCGDGWQRCAQKHDALVQTVLP